MEMVWAHRENGWVLYGQKSVDAGCQWRAGREQTPVKLNGWREGFGHQRDDGGGCERQEGVEGPGAMSMFERPFLHGSAFFQTAIPSTDRLSP